jgi:8-oxo-dGTP diphosphatase
VTVHAAGGVVWRRSGDGQLEILVVHRPRYDDWSLPKGKLHDAESALDGARREVEEETGLRCALGPELPSISYRDRLDRPKTVRYWAMTPVDGEFAPNDEVDELRWLPVAEAAAVLSYERDRPLLTALAELV